ncbi:hypothetical protein ACOSP7_005096 [Xanthoceras sorbifolium]|uniref:Pentatricopeptide repeat-containing protein n=1 Tax=Xanthoceras sorbifolium TaxID=99658 RepID=A0ABQ8IFN5_9ROSI|nr:hypothetical protein JRO89_XS02G0092300 [Xanthoceras sorbifolium]
MVPFFKRLPATFNFKIYLSCPQQIHSLSSNTNLSTLLQGRISRSHLLQIHARIYRLNAHQDNLIATKLIGHYPSNLALGVFNQLQNPNIFPFNAIIRVFAEAGLFSHSFSVFKSLKHQSLVPNDFTFSFLLKACLRSNDNIYVIQIHTHVLKLGFVCDSFVCNGLLLVYAKGVKDLVSARKMFDEVPDKSVVSCWTSLIAGYDQLCQSEEVLRLFCLMLKENLQPDNNTLVSVLSACSHLDVVEIENWVLIVSEFVDNINSKILACDSVNTVLIYLYGKCGKIEMSKQRFDKIDEISKRSVLPWNTMICAYVQNGFPIEALSLFRLMMEDSYRRPNHVTMVSVLSACAEVGDLELGRWVHEYMKSKGGKGVLESNTFLATALIDMYSKCGNLEKAKVVFDRMVSKDIVSFNAMIMGLALNGEGEEAVALFYKMQEFGLHPNAGTFLGVLCACNHSGLLERGRQIFLDMSLHFSIHPNMEHYACYVDLLARVGLIEEAFQVVASMPFKPNNFVLGALLGGCLLHKRLNLAQNLYKDLVELDPENSGGYVMLANTFAENHRWGDVSELRKFMREKGVKKHPGCSWISIGGVVHEFLVGSPSHPEIERIYHILDGLLKEMRVTSHYRSC